MASWELSAITRAIASRGGKVESFSKGEILDLAFILPHFLIFFISEESSREAVLNSIFACIASDTFIDIEYVTPLHTKYK